MPVHDPAAQKWERRRAVEGASPVTVLLNPTQRSAVERFIAADTGGPKRLTPELVLHRALNDFLNLNERTSFLGTGSGRSGAVDDARWE